MSKTFEAMHSSWSQLCPTPNRELQLQHYSGAEHNFPVLNTWAHAVMHTPRLALAPKRFLYLILPFAPSPSVTSREGLDDGRPTTTTTTQLRAGTRVLPGSLNPLAWCLHSAQVTPNRSPVQHPQNLAATPLSRPVRGPLGTAGG